MTKENVFDLPLIMRPDTDLGQTQFKLTIKRSNYEQKKTSSLIK